MTRQSPSELKQLVNQVARNLKLNRTLSEVGFVIATLLFACSGLLVLLIPFDFAAFHWLFTVVGISFITLLAAVCYRTWSSISEDDAACFVDERAGLKDELLSAMWFSSSAKQPGGSEEAFVSAHLTRAMEKARSIDANAIAPFFFPQSGKVAALAVVTLFVTWLGVSNVVIAKKGDLAEANLSSVNVDLVSDIITDPKASSNVEEINDALAVLNRDDISFEAKQEALKKAREVLDQINMDAVMTREGLSKLSKLLMEQDGFEGVGRALEQGNIKEAIGLLEEKREQLSALSDTDQNLNVDDQQAGATARSDNISSAEIGDAARDLLNEVGQPDPRNITRLIENLEQAQQDMESQERANTAASRMESAGERIGIAQTGAADYGGRSATSDQAEAGNGTPSPDAGNNDMTGGSLFRRGSVTANEEDQGDDGSSTGAPEGHAAALALEGRMTKRLDAILRLEKTEVEGDESVDSEDSAWEFQASKQGKARTEIVQGLDTITYQDSDVINGEFVSVEHRKSVQQYFLEIHEGNNR
jgi:hypothetical protein